jgi:cation transport ATPase
LILIRATEERRNTSHRRTQKNTAKHATEEHRRTQQNTPQKNTEEHSKLKHRSYRPQKNTEKHRKLKRRSYQAQKDTTQIILAVVICGFLWLMFSAFLCGVFAALFRG